MKKGVHKQQQYVGGALQKCFLRFVYVSININMYRSTAEVFLK